ncbi:MAG TPA: hypothetical protein VKW06_00075 [Candidatus Angelobacter sp.]|nr:hypothetical protein [Candidatus Angelobacter sp.]
MHSRRYLALIINAALLPAIAGAQATSAQTGAQDQPGSSTQTNGRGQGRWQQQRRGNAFFQALNLTEEQRRQFTQIQKEMTQAVWAARHDDSLSEEQMQQKIRQIHAQQRQKVQELLTPEQQEALKKWTEEHKPKTADTNASQASGASSAENAPPATGTGSGKPASDDDFFAGMVQDDPTPPTQPQRQNQKTPKN